MRATIPSNYGLKSLGAKPSGFTPKDVMARWEKVKKEKKAA
jgi:hypothetical protein